MGKQDFCQGCDQKDRCREVFERLGSAEGPSVAWKAVAAFLLPMAVFIVCLFGSKHILAGLTSIAWIQTVAGFAIASGVSIVSVVVARMVSTRVGKGR